MQNVLPYNCVQITANGCEFVPNYTYTHTPHFITQDLCTDINPDKKRFEAGPVHQFWVIHIVNFWSMYNVAAELATKQLDPISITYTHTEELYTKVNLNIFIYSL